MANRRRKPLKSTDPATQAHAKAFDKKYMNRRFLQNRRRIEAHIAGHLAKLNPKTEFSIVKRSLPLDGNTEVSQAKTNPDDFTSFMEILQPPQDTTLLVHANCFEVSDSFLKTLISEILTKLKRNKSPGSDLIRTDLFKLAPPFFH